MPVPRIQIDHERIAEFCRRHGIQRLALFGSVLRDDFGPDSDVDVLVEFEPGAIPGLEFFGMQRELSKLFARPVDLLTPGCIRPVYRARILGSAENIYVAA